MRICVVQTKSIKGDIQGNIEIHKKFIEQAVAHDANVIIFPELSLTGYEPSLAKALATDQEDGRFQPFQTLSNTHQLTIGVGVPTKSHAGIHISMILFQPQKERRTYSKKYLHADEEPFFVSGQNFPSLTIDKSNVAIAICYELSISEHAELAYQNGADFYIASVAKTASGVNNANKRLSDIARNYSMTVLMSNCVGPCEDFVGGGETAVWNPQGHQITQLNNTDEGLIIYDTDTEALFSTNTINHAY
ncbi:MAG: carbon-nitrogen hydrolase family protein [Chloroflexi bacterium]|nr:MAG: carbon-nitrogen hydrolase family protein [Chloroflexota bacterium]